MDAFPIKKSESLVAVSHPGKWGPFEALMLQGRIVAFISFMDYHTKRIFHHEIKDWTESGLHVDNFKRTVMECKRVNFFEPSMKWSRVAKKLQQSPTHEKKYSDQRMNFKIDNMLFVKQLFSFGLWTVPRGEGHVFQTSDAPMLIFHLPAKSLLCKPRPSTVRRSFVEQDQYLFDRYVLRPNSVYVVPPETSYLILTVQKTLFAVDVMAWEDVKGFLDFRTHREYKLPGYNFPPPTPRHEMQAPAMIMPEERRAKKRLRRKSCQPSEPVFVHLQQQDPEPVFVSPAVHVQQQQQQDPEPVFVSPAVHVQQQQPDPEPSHAPEDGILIFQEQPMETEDWINNIQTEHISQETINTFLVNFEKELWEMSSMGPAHQVQLERPLVHQPPTISFVLPPPPDNYWGQNESSPPISFGDLLNDHSGDVEPPVDLSLETRVVSPRQTHIFKPGMGPLDLSCT